MALTLKTLVADDERYARERLVALLEEFSVLEIAWQASDGDEVKKILESEKVDAVFLDINMPGASVFTTLETCTSLPYIVFQTAYSEFAVKAFQVNAVDYLLKPIDRELLSRTVDRIKERAERSESPSKRISRIPLRIGNAIKLVSFDDVHAIISREGFTYILTDTEELISESTLNFYEDLLDEKIFFRVSRAGIVHVDKIEKISQASGSNYSLLLKNGTTIPLSRRRAKDLRALLKIK